MNSEVMALPNFLMIKLGQASEVRVDLAVQRLTSLQLDIVSEFGVMVDRVKNKEIPLGDAVREMDRILAKKHRFGPVLIVLGYVLSCIGLTMLFRPELRSMIITGAAGILVGLMMLWSQKQPRFNLLLPIFRGDRCLDFDISAYPNGRYLWVCKSAHHAFDHVPAWSSFNHRDD